MDATTWFLILIPLIFILGMAGVLGFLMVVEWLLDEFIGNRASLSAWIVLIAIFVAFAIFWIVFALGMSGEI